ncbi:alpha/beta fold hydrolase [Pedobacter terrae]|uniref:alpha/beta fold hydrolase n=1 Tax=Pedobacter terrae TaxID=405671 RepID=UPI001FC90CEC|nr:alpha/beta hydrolase [Pedobacter terrae]
MELPTSLVNKYNLKVEGNLEAAQTLVFAHGFGTDQTSWRFVKEAFSENYRLVLYDNIGGGKSDPNAFSPIKYQELNTYASDLLEIVNVLNLKSVVLVAHSVSSMIGILAAIRNPAAFSKLILVGASPRYLNDEDYEGGFSRDDLDVLFKSMTANYYAWASGFSSVAMRNYEKPELGKEFASTLSELQPNVALSVAKVIFQSDCRLALPTLKNNVLIIQMKNDVAVPEAVGRYLHTHIEHSKLLEIDVEGHFPQLSAPDLLSVAIESFLNEQN